MHEGGPRSYYPQFQENPAACCGVAELNVKLRFLSRFLWRLQPRQITLKRSHMTKDSS
jgi:hypothetical protein